MWICVRGYWVSELCCTLYSTSLCRVHFIEFSFSLLYLAFGVLAVLMVVFRVLRT